MADAYPFTAQSNTPTLIAGGRRGEIGTIFARNPHASAGAYVKLYESASASAPDGDSVPRWMAWVPGSDAGATPPLPAGVEGGPWWIAVATEPAAGLTAPTTAFEISLSLRRV